MHYKIILRKLNNKLIFNSYMHFVHILQYYKTNGEFKYEPTKLYNMLYTYKTPFF